MQADTSPAQRCCDEYDQYQRKQWTFHQNRRDFLKTTVGALAAAPLLPHMVLNSALAQHASATSSTAPILVVIQLAGGNDGLNTIVPYSSGLYYSDRPKIAVPAKSVLPIDGTVGFNPNLKGTEAALRCRKSGSGAGGRVRQSQSIALPGHQYLGDSRTRQDSPRRGG